MKSRPDAVEYKEKNGALIRIYSDLCIEKKEADKVRTEIKNLIRQR